MDNTLLEVFNKVVLCCVWIKILFKSIKVYDREENKNYMHNWIIIQLVSEEEASINVILKLILHRKGYKKVKKAE